MALIALPTSVCCVYITAISVEYGILSIKATGTLAVCPLFSYFVTLQAISTWQLLKEIYV